MKASYWLQLHNGERASARFIEARSAEFVFRGQRARNCNPTRARQLQLNLSNWETRDFARAVAKGPPTARFRIATWAARCRGKVALATAPA